MFWQTIQITNSKDGNPWICHRYLVRTLFVLPPPSLTSVNFLSGTFSSLIFVFKFLISFIISVVCSQQLENVLTERRELNMQRNFHPGKKISSQILNGFGRKNITILYFLIDLILTWKCFRLRYEVDYTMAVLHEIALLSMCAGSNKIVHLKDVFQNKQELILVLE